MFPLVKRDPPAPYQKMFYTLLVGQWFISDQGNLGVKVADDIALMIPCEGKAPLRQGLVKAGPSPRPRSRSPINLILSDVH